MENNQIFISYAWKDREQTVEESREQIVNQLCSTFEKKGFKIIRDKSQLTYKDSIRNFMLQIAKGNFVIAIISYKYLTSEYCMFEAVETYKHGDFNKRVFPIVLDDAKIFDFVEQVKLVKYWEDKAKEYNELASTIRTQTSMIKILERVKDCEEIARKIDNILAAVADMNVLTSQMHIERNFADLIANIETKIDTENKKNKKKYIIQNIRNLILNAFTEDGFNDFCMYNFNSVYRQFTSGQLRTQRIRMLIEDAQTKLVTDKLLNLIKHENPSQYANFEPYTE